MNTHDIDIELPPPPEGMILEGIWAVPVDEVIVYRDACINAAIKANTDAKVREALGQAESMLRRGAYICKTLTLKGLLSAYADAIHALIPKGGSMTTKTDGGPAFPVWELNGSGKAEMTDFGMSLRDYFAAKALQGICASNPSEEWTDERIADDAYRLADAMLKARDE